MVTHPDGNEDVMVNWMFDVNWNWDDVESIRWVATALDAYGEFVWPAVSFSGQGNSKAVENDIQIESFEVRDEYGRLLSNQFSTFYPFPVKSTNDVSVSGTVRFQDASDARPQSLGLPGWTEHVRITLFHDHGGKWIFRNHSRLAELFDSW